MLNFNAIVVCFLIIAKVILTTSIVNEEDNLEDRTRNIVEFEFKERLKNGSEYSHKGIGVIIDARLVITNFAWDMKEKMRRYRRLNVEVEERSGTIYHISSFASVKSPVKYSTALYVSEWGRHVKQNVTDTEKIIDIPEGTQMTLIVTSKNLLQGVRKGMKLATRPPKPQDTCTVYVNIEKDHEDKKVKLKPISVQIMPPEYCEDELCEYYDPICVTSTSNEKSIQELTKGGEPLVCKNILTGIIRGGRIEGITRPVASVYENIDWIRGKIRQYREVRERVKSCGHQTFSYQIERITLINSLFGLLLMNVKM